VSIAQYYDLQGPLLLTGVVVLSCMGYKCMIQGTATHKKWKKAKKSRTIIMDDAMKLTRLFLSFFPIFGFSD